MRRWISATQSDEARLNTEITSNGSGDSVLKSFYARFAKNSIFFFISQVVGKGLFFLITVYLARLLGAQDYGKYAFAYGLVTLFSVVSKFGLDLLTSRDVGETPAIAANYFHASLTLRIALSIGFVLFIFAATFFLGKTTDVNHLIVLLAIAAAIQSIAGAGTSLLEGLQSFGYRALLNVCTYGFILLAVVLATRSGGSFAAIGPAFVIGASIYLLVTLVLAHFKIAPIKLSFDFAFLMEVLRKAVPLGLTDIFIGIYYRADTVLLSLFDTDQVVGWYDAAYTFVYVLRLLPVTAALVLLPALSNVFSNSERKGVEVYRTIVRYSAIAGFLIVFLTTINSEWIVSLIFGDEYSPSAAVLKVLIWTCAIMFINAFQGILLIITHKRVAFFWATAIGAVSNILLNLFLIPKWSMYGAAVATVASEFLVFLACATALRKLLSGKVYAEMILFPLIATLMMAALWFVIGSKYFWIGNFMCILLYAGVLWFAGIRNPLASARE